MPEYGHRFVGYAKPHCGTTTMHRYLTRFDRASRRAGQHDPASKNRGLRTKRVAVAPDRNPLTWYPSLYAHFHAVCPSWGRGGLEVLDDAFGGRDFRTVLYGLTHGVSAERVGLVTEAGTLAQFESAGVGLATWMSWWTYGERSHPNDTPKPTDAWAVDVLVPQCRLTDGFSRVLGEDCAAVESVNKRTGASHMPPDYRQWYDDEMIGWVKSADWPLFAFLGWDGWACAPASVVHTRGRNLMGGVL